MKRALAHSALILVACFITVGAKGQQVYQFSQYLQNLYILNSATAGLHDYTEVNLSYRNQWVGITNSPTTYYVSVTQPLGKRIEINPQNSSVRISSPAAYTSIQRKSYHAVGGYAAQDSYGPYGLTMAGMSYTFHLPIAKQLSVAFSPSVGYTSVTFDQSKAVVHVDEVVSRRVQVDPTVGELVVDVATAEARGGSFRRIPTLRPLVALDGQGVGSLAGDDRAEGIDGRAGPRGGCGTHPRTGRGDGSR